MAHCMEIVKFSVKVLACSEHQHKQEAEESCS